MHTTFDEVSGKTKDIFRVGKKSVYKLIQNKLELVKDQKVYVIVEKKVMTLGYFSNIDLTTGDVKYENIKDGDRKQGVTTGDNIYIKWYEADFKLSNNKVVSDDGSVDVINLDSNENTKLQTSTNLISTNELDKGTFLYKIQGENVFYIGDYVRFDKDKQQIWLEFNVYLMEGLHDQTSSYILLDDENIYHQKINGGNRHSDITRKRKSTRRKSTRRKSTSRKSTSRKSTRRKSTSHKF